MAKRLAVKDGRGGKREGAGRPKGSQSKVTLKIKETIMRAYDEVGGKDYLVSVARDDPKTSCMLLAKILPAELVVDADVSGQITLVKLSDLRDVTNTANDD